MEENIGLRTDAANVYLQAKAYRRQLEAGRSRGRKHLELHLGQLVYVWRVSTKQRQMPAWNGSWIGPTRVLAHQHRPDGRLGRVVWVVHNTALYRVAPDHLRDATPRERLIAETTVGNVMPNFEDVLCSGRVVPGICVDLTEQ